MLSIEEIYSILIDYYGVDTERGCYVGDKWFSIDEVIRLLKKNV